MNQFYPDSIQGHNPCKKMNQLYRNTNQLHRVYTNQLHRSRMNMYQLDILCTLTYLVFHIVLGYIPCHMSTYQRMSIYLMSTVYMN